MNVKKFTLFALPIFVVGFSAFTLFEKAESRYFPRETQLNRAASLSTHYEEFMHMLKANRETGRIDYADIARAKAHIDRMSSQKSLNIGWAFKGPDNIGGRTRALIIDRNNPDHILAAGVSGGLFESFDGATSWTPYDTDYKVSTISCIAQDAAGDFYIGTGSHFEGTTRDPFISNSTQRSSSFMGSGVYKLTGSGTYELVVGPDTNQNPNFGLDYATVGNIVADPNIPGKIYVAANHGFRILTKDGTGWKDTTTIAYDQKCLDVNIEGSSVLVTFKDNTAPPYDSARVYASTDNMQSWTMTQFNAGRIEAAIAPTANNVMYLSAATAGGCLYNIYRSSDGGQTWGIIGPGGSQSFDMFANIGINCQGYWDNLLSVSPYDEGKIFVGGVILYSWTQSSVDPAPPNGSWRRIDVTADRYDLGGFLDPRYVHADKHTMVFHPTKRNIAYIATDGGVTRSDNIEDPQPFFQESNGNFGVTQFYYIGVNSNGVVLGGTQDNGSNLMGLKYNQDLSGLQVLGGDGFGSELSTINTQIGVASLYFNRFVRIQGIGTNLGNTNISRADIISNNAFFGGLCNGIGCLGPFNTVLELWESYDHVASRDTVEVIYERVSLPPLPSDSVIIFEGNNNDYPQRGALADQDTFPIDTVYAGTRDVTYIYEEGKNNYVVANHDTIFIDKTQMQIYVKRRGQADTTISPYSVGSTYSFSNVISDPYQTEIEVEFENSFVVTIPNSVFRYRLKFHDKVQSILASANWAGLTNTVDPSERNIIITRDLLKNTPDIKWFNIAGRLSTPDPIQPNNTVLCMEFSRDGDVLFAGTSNGDVFRISGINHVHDDTTTESVGGNLYSIQTGILAGKCRRIGRFTQRAVTGLSVDPNDANNVVVVLGNYGSDRSIARTTFALTATDPGSTFEFINGSGSTALPPVPAYSVLIDKNSKDTVFIGTESICLRM